jgi:hypothetical protein
VLSLGGVRETAITVSCAGDPTNIKSIWASGAQLC